MIVHVCGPESTANDRWNDRWSSRECTYIIRAFREGLLKEGGFDDSDFEFSFESTPGVSGFFEVTVNGENVHSKKDGQGFPDAAKIKAIVAKMKAILDA